MPRVNFVKKARKDNSLVKKGESYYWWKFRRGGKHLSKTYPKQSQLTQSEFLGELYSLQEEIDELVADESLASAVEDLAERFRTLGEEQSDKRDNMPEGLQDSPTGELLQTRADRCEEIASDLEGLDLEDDGEERTEEEKEEYWQDKLDEVQGVDFDCE